MSLVARQYTPEQLLQLRGTVRERMLREAPYVRQANFVKIASQDLLQLFRLYDELLLGGELSAAVVARTGKPMTFRISRAMSSSGGKATWYNRRSDGDSRFEISVSSALLFNSFRDPARAVHVSGQVCSDRLDALMRIMEHELVHVIEMVSFGNSSCSKTRFMTIAQNLFGHSHSKHQLVTHRERVAREHNLHVGQQVGFSYEGRELRGLVNRIGLRATVLVKDPHGRRYSDGYRYVKYLVPPVRLTPVA